MWLIVLFVRRCCIVTAALLVVMYSVRSDSFLKLCDPVLYPRNNNSLKFQFILERWYIIRRWDNGLITLNCVSHILTHCCIGEGYVQGI